jgi:hypothetical protein
MARVRKAKPKARPIYPTRGRIHILINSCYKKCMLEMTAVEMWPFLNLQKGHSCCVFPQISAIAAAQKKSPRHSLKSDDPSQCKIDSY